MVSLHQHSMSGCKTLNTSFKYQRDFRLEEDWGKQKSDWLFIEHIISGWKKIRGKLKSDWQIIEHISSGWKKTGENKNLIDCSLNTSLHTEGKMGKTKSDWSFIEHIRLEKDWGKHKADWPFIEHITSGWKWKRTGENKNLIDRSLNTTCWKKTGKSKNLIDCSLNTSLHAERTLGKTWDWMNYECKN